MGKGEYEEITGTWSIDKDCTTAYWYDTVCTVSYQLFLWKFGEEWY